MNISVKNTSSHELAVYPLQFRHNSEVIAETLVACVLFILGVTGNALVCYVIYKKKFTNSSMYFFMLNLACADLLVCFISIPLTLLSTRPKPVEVRFGQVGCKVIRFLQYMLPPASVAILTATAIDRYFHICFPLKRMFTTRSTKQLAAISWGFAIFLTSPVFFLIETVDVTYDGKVYEFCNIKETSSYHSAGMIYLVFRGLLGFAIPLAVISVLYFRIVQTVWQRKNQHQSTNKQRANVVKSLLTVVVAFSMSWAPFSVCNKYYLFHNESFITRQEIISFWVGLTASVYNPVIYAFYNKKFRDAFAVVIFGRKRSMPSTDTAMVEAGKHRPRAKTLPALLTLETQQFHNVLERNRTGETKNKVKTRHLSLGCQPLYNEAQPRLNHATRKFTSRKPTLPDLAEHSSEVITLDKINDQLTTDYTNSHLQLINACADEVSEKSSPTRDSEHSVPEKHDRDGQSQNGSVKKRQRRKIGLPYLLPIVQVKPQALQRSHTFHNNDRLSINQNRDSSVNDVMCNYSQLHFSRNGIGVESRGVQLSRSMSLHENRTVNGIQRYNNMHRVFNRTVNGIHSYDNHVSRL